MPKELRLGIFIVAALVMFGAGIFLIGNQQLRFSSTYRVYADFQNVVGLEQGAVVRVGGVHEGTVGHIELPHRPDGKVRVALDMKAATRDVIKKDSVASIRTEGLVGDQYVEVSFGTADSARVKEGDTIGGETPLEISDMIKKVNGLLDSAQGAVQSVTQSAANLDVMSAKMNSGKGTVGALINDRSMYQHLNQVASNLQDDTEALKHNFLLRGFFKKRGYEDAAELKRDAVNQVPSATPDQQFQYQAGKLFDHPDDAKMKNSKTLNQAGEYLQNNPVGLAVVAGYADQKGDSDKQLQLTRARAAAVREYLVQHYKLDDTRIKIIGMGKTAGVPDGGAVDVLVYSPAKVARQAAK